jgi:internalin A
MRTFLATLFLLSTTPCWADPEKDAEENIPKIPGVGHSAPVGSKHKLVSLNAIGKEITDQTIAEIMRYRAGLGHLQGLHIQWSKVTDAGMKEIHGLPGLNYFWLLANEKITDEGLSAIKDLPNLRELQTSGTPITGTGVKPEIMPNLESLSMYECPITKEGLKVIAKHKKLRYLELSWTPVKDISSLRELPNLKIISLRGTAVNDESMAAFSSESVEEMVLHNTELTGATLKGFKNLQQLRMIETKVNDEGLKGISELKSLKLLWLTNTNVTDAGLKHLAGLTNLEELYLDGTKVNGSGIKELSGCKALKSLKVKMTDETVKGLAEMKMLHTATSAWIQSRKPQPTDNDITSLSLGEITDDGLKCLQGFTSLKNLNLHGAKVTDEGVMELQKALPKLKIHR